MPPRTRRLYERRLGRRLTDEEVLALLQMTTGYPQWRERYSETLAEHMAHKPRGISARTWYFWYRHPFGNQEMNRRHNIVRRLVQEGI